MINYKFIKKIMPTIILYVYISIFKQKNSYENAVFVIFIKRIYYWKRLALFFAFLGQAPPACYTKRRRRGGGGGDPKKK
jgi:hypothetical protein